MQNTTTTPTTKKLSPVTSPAPIAVPTQAAAPIVDGATPEQSAMQAEIARLQAENAALRTSAKSQTLSLRISDKGGVSVYGLGKFPITLYKEQWRKLLALATYILEFIDAHEGQLKSKESK